MPKPTAMAARGIVITKVFKPVSWSLLMKLIAIPAAVAITTIGIDLQSIFFLISVIPSGWILNCCINDYPKMVAATASCCCCPLAFFTGN